MITNLDRLLTYEKQNKCRKLSRRQERRMKKKMHYAEKRNWMPGNC